MKLRCCITTDNFRSPYFAGTSIIRSLPKLARGSHDSLALFVKLIITADGSGVEIASAHLVSNAKPVAFCRAGRINWAESNVTSFGKPLAACSKHKSK